MVQMMKTIKSEKSCKKMAETIASSKKMRTFATQTTKTGAQ
jgi:hypothetical protein